MANFCEDCGTKLNDGRCPNCSEELVIFEDQISEMQDFKVSDEFINKVNDQREKENKRSNS